MGMIADQLRNNLKRIKIESDKNDKLIAESFELLNEIKERDEEYDESKEFNPVIVSTEGIPFASYFNISPSEVGHFLQYGTIQ